MTDEIQIRPYKKEDRQRVREICYDTALMGESADTFFEGKDLLEDAVTIYYTDYEPESVFVAECNGKVVGYLTGCVDSKRYSKVFANKIFPGIFARYFLSGAVFKPKTAKFLFHCTAGLLKGEFKSPSLPECPAHLHVNIDKNYRRMGIGRRLIASFIEYLEKKNIKGVYLNTMSDGAVSFFKKAGFREIYSRKVTQLNYLFKKNAVFHIMARAI